MAKTCPTDCGRDEKPGKLMCVACWYSVPRPLRLDVLRTWKALQTRPRGGDAAEVRKLGTARVEAYRKARDAAVAAARERLIKRDLAEMLVKP